MSRLPEFGPSAAQPLEPVRESDYVGGRWFAAVFIISALIFVGGLAGLAMAWGAV